MSETIIDKTETLAGLPSKSSGQVDVMAQIQAMLKASDRVLVVLDDDPTGTQTVYDIPVLTEWLVESLQRELSDNASAFYILTNFRSLPTDQAQALN